MIVTRDVSKKVCTEDNALYHIYTIQVADIDIHHNQLVDNNRDRGRQL